MHESFVDAWTREPHFGGATLHSLRDLNRLFLDLAVTTRGEWVCEGRITGGIALRLAPLSALQREAAANCPYALFDLRFCDAAHWQQRLRSSPWQVADEPAHDSATVDFVRLAIFYAWHVARIQEMAVRLLLGMSCETAEAFREATVDRLPGLALTESAHLSARFSDCAVYWGALTRAASDANPTQLRRVQLHGLQLAATSNLRGH